jgi:hypothetical protein
MNDIGRCVLMRIQSPTATATANPADTNMLLWESEISRAAERALSKLSQIRVDAFPHSIAVVVVVLPLPLTGSVVFLILYLLVWAAF